MSTKHFTTVTFDSPTLLSQIADRVNKPLSEMVRLLELIRKDQINDDHSTERLASIMLENSGQIEQLIEDILLFEKEKRLEIQVHDKLKYAQLYPSLNGRVAKLDQEWLVALEKKVEHNLSKPFLEVDWLAYELATSRRNLFRKIEKLTNLTPNAYIRSIRLLKAKELLEKGTYATVNELASAVGFRDSYYFSNLYKEEFGVKPKECL
jgi:AraC-like DNA-binding protein